MLSKRSLRINVIIRFSMEWWGRGRLQRLSELRAWHSVMIRAALTFRHNPGSPQFRCRFALRSIIARRLLLL